MYDAAVVNAAQLAPYADRRTADLLKLPDAV
jgi:hypothetical protein